MYRRHREDLTKPPEERSAPKPKGVNEKTKNNKKNQEKQQADSVKNKPPSGQSQNRVADNSKTEVKMSFKQKQNGTHSGAHAGGAGGIIIEETSMAENFDNKTDDDKQHEREINGEPTLMAETSSSRRTANIVGGEDNSTASKSSRHQRNNIHYSQYSRRERPHSPATDRSATYRKSVFTLMRDNTEFEEFRVKERQLMEEERLANESESRDNNSIGTHSARTRTTHQTNSTHITQLTNEEDDESALNSQIIIQDKKLSDIAKFLHLIEENNVAAVIKYVDVYALKLLMKFDDGHVSKQ